MNIFNSKASPIIAILLLIIVVILVPGCSEKTTTNFYVEKGVTLNLQRGNDMPVTKRAIFDNSNDCSLIAKNMNIAEPRVNWFCN